MKTTRFQRFILSFISVFFPLILSAETIKIGLVLDKGGRDDRSFNSAAFKGAKDAEAALGIKVKVVESSDDTALEPNLRTFAQKGYDLVIGIGFVQLTPLSKVAKEFPKTHFLIVDSVVDLPNVRSVIFKEHEGSYLIGAIAALTSKTKKIGFVGGMDIPLIRRFEMGYKAGAEAIEKNIKIVSNFVGSSSDAWKNPMKAKELAIAQYKRGVDIIYGAAGASGAGVFDAAEQEKKFAIGVDSNQNWIKPGLILTSMLKRVDLSVFQTIEMAKNGKFEAGKFALGLKEKMIDYALDEHNRSILTPEVEKKANELKEKIVQGLIQVPDYYEVMKKKKS